MSGSTTALFSDACGADGPLVLDVRGGVGPGPSRRAFPRPFVVVGRSPDADLVLDDPAVSPRHAYLQLVAGRVCCVDLGSASGTFLDGRPLRTGWVDRGRALRIGPAALSVFGGDRRKEAGPGPDPDGPSPLSVEYAGPDPLPDVTLEITREGSARVSLWPMARALVLVGRATTCNVRLHHPGIAPFQSALVRTPAGVWLVDLLSSRDLATNGTRERVARLAEGDVVRVGPFALRPRYGTTAVAGVPARPTLPPPGTPEGPDGGPLMDQVMQMQQQMFGQFGQMMMSMAQMFGTMHRDQMDLVQKELEAIRRMAEELHAFRAEGAGAAPVPARSASGSDTPRRDPREIQALVDERLAAFERERQDRWKTILKLVTGR